MHQPRVFKIWESRGQDSRSFAVSGCKGLVPEAQGEVGLRDHSASDVRESNVVGVGWPDRETQNPKILAMMLGNLSPNQSGGSFSVGRPGGGYAEYTSPGDGFGVTRPPQPFRRD